MRANFVGVSVVSAITHTPASGPFELVTTPPMSSGSMATLAAAGLCCACSHAIEEMAPTTMANADMRIPVRNFMAPRLRENELADVNVQIGARRGIIRLTTLNRKPRFVTGSEVLRPQLAHIRIRPELQQQLGC